MAVFLLFVVYPLSAGPVERLYLHGYVPDPLTPVLRGFYGPLRWLSQEWDVFGKFMKWYVLLWLEL